MKCYLALSARCRATCEAGMHFRALLEATILVSIMSCVTKCTRGANGRASDLNSKRVVCCMTWNFLGGGVGQQMSWCAIGQRFCMGCLGAQQQREPPRWL